MACHLLTSLLLIKSYYVLIFSRNSINFCSCWLTQRWRHSWNKKYATNSNHMHAYHNFQTVYPLLPQYLYIVRSTIFHLFSPFASISSKRESKVPIKQNLALDTHSNCLITVDMVDDSKLEVFHYKEKGW